MGTDIHDYIEIRKPRQKRWRVVKRNIIDGRRDYWLFAIMAGVRGVPPKIVDGLHRAALVAQGLSIRDYGKPKGLPEDISDALKRMKRRWDYGHSWSWG